MNLKKNLKLILLLFKLKLSHTMVFRLSFFGAFFADGTLFLVQLLTFHVVYGQVDTIGGWSRGQMLVFVGTFSLINALNMLVFFFGLVDLPGKIRRGELDQYLTKPVNPLLRLTFENVNPGSLPLIVLSILILLYGLSVLHIALSPLLWIGYLVFVLAMTLLWYDMMLIFRTIPFFVISVNGIMRVEEVAIDLNMKVPGVLYRGFLKVLFYFILPYGIMATVPTSLITGGISPRGLLVGALTVAFFTVFALRFFRFGLRHYKSAGS